MPTLQSLLARIETQLGWPAPADWTGAHFEELSERIRVASGVRLSVATLKRVWGRLKYRSSPSRTTLDALAQFAGYGGWVEAEAELGEDRAPGDPGPPPMRWPDVPAPVLGVLGALAGVLLVAGLTQYLPRAQGPPAEVLRFGVEQINTGLPATVQFRYLVNGGAYDSMQVQQSWDARLRHAVDPGRGFYACTYYYPGVYAAKLLLDTALVAERSLVLASGGWLGTVDRPSSDAPIYLREGVLEDEGSLASITPSHLRAHRLGTADLHSALHYIGGLDTLATAGGFTLATSFRNTTPSACAKTELIVFGETGTLVLPFGKTGCSGEFALFAAGREYPGSAYDLSGFSVSETQGARAVVTLDGTDLRVDNFGREALRETLRSPIGKVLGVRWRFAGLGEVQTFGLAGLPGS